MRYSISEHTTEGNENPKNHIDIQNHPILDGFSIHEDNGKNNFQLISNKGEVLTPLTLSYPETPDDINKLYKSGEIRSTEVGEKLKEYEEHQLSLDKQFDSLGWEWGKGMFYSIHGGHNIENLFPKSLQVDFEAGTYKTNENIRIDKDTIDYIGTYGKQSIFIATGRSFGEMSHRGFSDNIYLFSLDKENKHTAKLTGGIYHKVDFKIFDYENHLLLGQSISMLGSENKQYTVKVLSNPDGVLSEDLFSQEQTDLTETSKKTQDVSSLIDRLIL